MTTTTLISPADYLAQEAVASFKSEYHDGVVIPMPGAQPPHNRIKINVGYLLVDALDTGYEVWDSDTQVHIPATHSYVYPDVTVVAGASQFDTTAPIAVLLNPTLIVEVLSPTTEQFDRSTKFSWYQSIPTFREYLLIAQEQVAVTHWVRGADDTWAATSYTKLDDSIALVAVPVVLPVARVYHRVTSQ